MKILKPNNGKEIVPISKNSVYVYITDYGLKAILKEIKIGPAQHTWYWIKLKSETLIDVSEINGYYCSFDNAINKEVNNAYCTVYEFQDFEDMCNNWNDIKYIDNIETVYKSES